MSLNQKEGFWFKVFRKLTPDYIGVYLGSEYILICKPLNNEIKEYSIQKANSNDVSFEQRFQYAIFVLRKYFKRWPFLRIVLCSPPDEPKISTEFLKMNAEKYNCSLVTVDFRICIAIGAGIDINEPKKQIFLVISELVIHGYVVFCTNIISSAKTTCNGSNFFDTAENLVTELKNSVKPTMPKHLEALDDDSNRLRNGWKSDFSDEINLFLLKASNDLVGKTIVGHSLIFHRDAKDCLGSGMIDVARDITMYWDPFPPPRKT